MNKSTKYLLLGAAVIAMALVAFPTFADTLQQSGVGNNAYQDSFNTHIGNNNAGPNAGGSLTNLNFNDPSAKAYADSDAIAVAGGGQGGKGGKGGSATLNQNFKRNVASAIAPAVYSTGEDNCQAGVSAGGQTQIFGLSLGGSVNIRDCFRLKYGARMAARGESDAEKNLYCQNEDAAQAYADAGTPCGSKLAPATGGSRHRSEPARAYPGQPSSVFN